MTSRETAAKDTNCNKSIVSISLRHSRFTRKLTKRRLLQDDIVGFCDMLTAKAY